MKKVWKKFSVVVLFISVLVLLLQSFRADEPRLGVALIGPYREDGVVILQYRVTNFVKSSNPVRKSQGNAGCHSRVFLWTPDFL